MNSEMRENQGYKSNKNYNQISRSVGEAIDAQPFKDAELARNKENALIKFEEKGYTRQLIELGKICGFVEAIYNIPLNEQEISQVGPFDKPNECQSFKKGYESGKMLAKNGFTEQNYLTFLENYEAKYKIKGSKSK